MADEFLKIESKDLFCKFVHECVDDLIEKKEANLNNFSVDIEWKPDSFRKALNTIQNAYRKAAIGSSKDLQIPDLKEDFQECLEECYSIREHEITQFLLKKQISKGDQLFVENIDWKLNWIMGSSTLSTLREPLLKVELHCLKRQKDKVRPTVKFEMNSKQVEELINELERAQRELKIQES